MRKPFQGLVQVIRFNWHFYVLAVAAIAISICFASMLEGWPRWVVVAGAIYAVLVMAISLVSTYIAYDLSELYAFTWLPSDLVISNRDVVHIHAGFDEVSAIIHQKYRPATLQVFDFFDPKKHTEISIRRARKVSVPFPGTLPVETSRLPIPDQSIDLVFLFLSAHEIRNEKERVQFMLEVYRVLREDGCVVLTEHLRDGNNFLAYNIGFFHFHSYQTWKKVIHLSGFEVSEVVRISPFISSFILQKNG